MSRPRLHDDGFLAFLRTKPCCICGRVGETEAAHIRIGFRAMQKKPDDRYALPLCAYHHRNQHRVNESAFWDQHGDDPFDIAARLYAEFGGDGGKPKAKRKPKPRKPKHLRQKIASRGFQRRKKQ